MTKELYRITQNAMALACLWRISYDKSAMRAQDLNITIKDLYFGNDVKQYISQMIQLEKGMGSFRYEFDFIFN
jgi:hypothetical protein